MFPCKCAHPLLALLLFWFPLSNLLCPILYILTTALHYLYTTGGIAQLTGNRDSLPYFGKMLAYL